MTTSPRVSSSAALPLLTIALCALLPVLFHAAFGYAGHDYRLHLSSWLELSRAWKTGIFYPGWSPLSQLTLGDPHLSLYPPASMFLGALLATLLPFNLVPAAFLWIALTAAGVSMYLATKPFVTQGDRLPAAILYLLSPYVLMTALVRFAAAELLVLAFLPLVLAAFYRAVWQRSPRMVVALAALLALGWITNVPASIMMFYTLLVVTLACAFLQRSRRSIRPVLHLGLAFGLAGLLAAFYLWPTLAERSLIHPDALLRADPRDLLLFHLGLLQAPTLKLFHISLWTIACCEIVLLLACALLRRRDAANSSPVLIWLIAAAVACFFQCGVSGALWQHLPQLATVGFPFRFLAVIAAVLPLVLLSPETRPVLKIPVCATLAVLALLPFAQHAITQRTASTRTPSTASLLAEWQRRGDTGVAEFLPAGALTPSLPPLTPVDPPCILARSAPGATQPFARTATSPGGAACVVSMNINFYPYWVARLETGADALVWRNPDGTMKIVVPPGRHLVTLEFRPVSFARVASLWVSLLTAVALLAAFWFGRFRLLRLGRQHGSPLEQDRKAMA